MKRKTRIYYIPIEIPHKIHYISKEKNLDVTYEADEVPYDFPVYFDTMFKALKSGEFDEIIVSVTEHNGCYYSRKVDGMLYERIPMLGEICLSQFSDGGGCLRDKHWYAE